MILSNEQKETIRDLWNSGKTGAEIGKLYGMSRCAVIGLMNRMRKKGQEVNSKPKFKQPKKKRVRKETAPKVIAAPPPRAKLPENIELIDLTSRSCRFVVSAVDEAPILFCGKHIDQRSYCEEHAKICYLPSRYSEKYQSVE